MKPRAEPRFLLELPCEFGVGTTERTNEMKSDNPYVCPRCEYPLVPVHAVEGAKRRVIALSCPEPYCDHMQMVPRKSAPEYALESTAVRRHRAAHGS